MAATLALFVAAVLVQAPDAGATALGPNGKIAFVKGNDIFATNADGSGLTQITSTLDLVEAEPAYSPDGNYIAFVQDPGNGPSDTSFDSIYAIRADTADQPTLIKSGVAVANELAWSPDGTKIAFHRYQPGNAGIWVVNVDGSGLTSLLTTNDNSVDSPSWSPDGTKIAFRHGKEIWTMNADGTGQTQLTFSGVNVFNNQPNWSPDGSTIVFSSNRDCVGCGSADIYSMPSSGGAATRLTNSASLFYNFDPVWSPDGTRIAFSTCPQSDSGCATDLYVMNADGTSPTVVQGTSLDEVAPDWQPAVGPPLPGVPDLPQKIVFASNRGHPGSPGDYDLFLMNPDGTRLRSLMDDHRFDFNPAWSPDGQKIAFVSGRSGPDQIWVMNADGTGATKISNITTTVDAAPAWSPDGTKIAFVRQVGSLFRLWTMNADGTGQTQVSTAPTSNNEGDPDWSPDGTKIAFTHEQGIYTIKPDGTGLTLVTTGGDYNQSPDWSRDGSMILFAKYLPVASGSQGDIWTVNADGTNPTRLTTGGATYPVWSPDGTRIAFSTGDIYVMNADGTNRVNLTNRPGTDTDPAWQPVIGYPRPKGATPLRASLTIAYKACTTPNRDHGPPLVTGSCNPPQMASDYLTVGTGDANGMLPRSEGGVRYDVVTDKPATPADESDVKLKLDMSDVFTKSLADYAGELRASVAVQATDRNNSPYPGGRGPATLPEFLLEFDASCSPTADTTVGSVCSAATSANAVVPGLVKGGYRSLWELRQVKVFDGGADSVGNTTGDNTLFADEGVFAP